MDLKQFHEEDYKEYLEDIDIAISAMKESLLYPAEEILFDLYAIPSHNHQAYYAVVVEKDGAYEMVYAKTEITYIELEETVRMYTFSSAKRADSSSGEVGKIIIGIAKLKSDFADLLKDIGDTVPGGRYYYENLFMLDGVFQVVRVFNAGKPVKEIVYENTDGFILPADREYLRDELGELYLTVEEIIS